MEQFPYELRFDHRPVTIPDLYGHQRKRSAVDVLANHAGKRVRCFYLGGLDIRKLQALFIDGNLEP